MANATPSPEPWAPCPELRVLLAGGGSGGSATPVLAVAQTLAQLRPGVRFLYVGTRDGPEAQLAAQQGLPFVAVASGRLRRYWDRRNLTDPLHVVHGVEQAAMLARRFRPRLAFAAGGFASVPAIAGARLAGARVVIHQQDVRPGLANRLLMPLARRVTLALPESTTHFRGARTEVTGNPVRAEILAADPRLAIARLRLQPELPLVVATGGGTGALGLNRIVAAAAGRLVGACQIVHLTGRGRGVPAPVSDRYQQYEFLVDELPPLLAAATVVISRAGMGTLSELAALGRPALVIPLPASHQWDNARAFAGRGAVEVLDQDALSAEVLAERVLGLLADASRRRRLGATLAATMPRDAAQRVAEALLAEA
jgi:UDP-N-acetylglucosamine--N-acetylmuramyl-(pentapeptide) pyrophosphoryl-undecaprenol N-acetylglucosamine transferase